MAIAQYFSRIAVFSTMAVAIFAPPASAQPVSYASQGGDWNEPARQDFYTRDQGSRMIPLNWFTALRKPNGQPFLADALAAYGYLPNPASPDGLPVGFVAADNQPGEPPGKTLGMTCAACHTRQISVGGQALRIDGGPAFADFQSLMMDIDAAATRVAASDAAFADFAKRALGPAAGDAAAKATLRSAFTIWRKRFHTIMDIALPKDAAGHWGPSRLDAVSMIFNRIAGLDIGPGDDRIIADNIKPADAPVRYPFVWNAGKQDKTQWPAFAPNGDDVFALVRNVGEVMGVFAEFAPTSLSLPPFPTLALFRPNSVNFDGLWKIESLMSKIGAPAWKWPIDETLRKRGEEIFGWPTSQEGCADCHGERPGAPRALNPNTWATCVADAGTDIREWQVLGRTAATGRLEGVLVPGPDPKMLGKNAAMVDIMMASVTGALADHLLRPDSVFRNIGVGLDDAARNFSQSPANLIRNLPPPLDELKLLNNDTGNVYAARDRALPDCAVQKLGYEARVLKGIWAAAPYLHNGSVPTLADLLQPAARRPASFRIGPNYDLAKVGLSATQAPAAFTLTVTGCDNRASGRSNCGHEYGTKLSDADKAALLEYLKSL